MRGGGGGIGQGREERLLAPSLYFENNIPYMYFLVNFSLYSFNLCFFLNSKQYDNNLFQGTRMRWEVHGS